MVPRRVGGLPGEAAPAQRRAERLGRSRFEVRPRRPAGPEDAAAQVVRAQPGARSRAGALRDELADAAAPAGIAFVRGVDEAAFDDRDERAARCRRRRCRAFRQRTGRRPRGDRVGPLGRQRRRRDAQLGVVRACAAGNAHARVLDRASRGVDAVDRERRVERRVGGAADPPAAFGAVHRDSRVAERRCVQLAIALQRRPAAFDVRLRCNAAADRLVVSRSAGAEPRREMVERGSVDREPPLVGAAAGAGEAALRARLVAGGRDLECRSRAAVVVDVARRALDGDADERARQHARAGAAARRRDRLEHRQCARLRQREIELGVAVQAARAAREQRVGAARPPRQRIEVGQPDLAARAPRRRRVGARELARCARLRAAERRFGDAKVDRVQRRPRFHAQARGCARGARQATIGERTRELRDDFDRALLGRCREVAAGERHRAGERRFRRARVERCRADAGEIGSDVPAVGAPAPVRDDAAAGAIGCAELGAQRLDLDRAGRVGPRAQRTLGAHDRQAPLVPAAGACVREIERDQRRLVEAAGRHDGMAGERCRRRCAREGREIERLGRRLECAERPGGERAHDRVRVERLRGASAVRGDTRRRVHVEPIERAGGVGARLPRQRRAVARGERDVCRDRQRSVGADRHRAARTDLVAHRGDIVEAMTRTAVGAEMDARAQRRDRRRIVAADAQLVDARRADLELDRQAQARGWARRLAAAARRARREPGRAVGVQGLDAQVQPAAVVAARGRERVPARPVEAEHAAARDFDLDPLGGKVAEQRSARRSHRQLRHAREQPRGSGAAVHRPEQRRERADGDDGQQREHAGEPAQGAPAPPALRRFGSVARRRSRAGLVHDAPIRT